MRRAIEQASTVAFAAVLSNVLGHLDELLSPSDFSDYCPNGLQVPGPEHIETIVTGVSASAELFRRAAAEDADLVIVHHGLFWSGAPLALTPAAKQRLRLLFEHDMALAAYHLPLDAHLDVGNNALLARGLGAHKLEPFAVHRGRPIGVAACFDADGITIEELVSRTRALTGREPLAFPAGPERVRSIGIVSGAGSAMIGEAAALGLDALLTGEPAEHAMADAREARLHFIAAGHYATETLGVQSIGAFVEERFGVPWTFLHLPTGS